MSSADEAIAKIRKIMRLVRKAATEGERQAALQAASRLAQCHNIHIEDFTDYDIDIAETVVVHDNKFKTTNQSVEVRLATQVLYRHFGVVVFWKCRRDGLAKRTSLSWVGNKLNIGVAKYAFEIMLRESRKHWRECQGWGFKRDHFIRGWFYTIERKLEENPLRNDTDVFNKETEDARKKIKRLEEEGDFTQRHERRVRNFDHESVIRGAKMAERVNLSRPVGSGGYSQTPVVGVRQALGYKVMP